MHFVAPVDGSSGLIMVNAYNNRHASSPNGLVVKGTKNGQVRRSISHLHIDVILVRGFTNWSLFIADTISIASVLRSCSLHTGHKPRVCGLAFPTCTMLLILRPHRFSSTKSPHVTSLMDPSLIWLDSTRIQSCESSLHMWQDYLFNRQS